MRTHIHHNCEIDLRYNGGEGGREREGRGEGGREGGREGAGGRVMTMQNRATSCITITRQRHPKGIQTSLATPSQEAILTRQNGLDRRQSMLEYMSGGRNLCSVQHCRYNIDTARHVPCLII